MISMSNILQVSHFLRYLRAAYHSSSLYGLFMLVSWFWPLWQPESRKCCGCPRCEFYSAECRQWYTLKSSRRRESSSFSSSSYRTVSCILSSVPVLPWCRCSMFWRPSRFSILCDFCEPVIIHPVYMIALCSFLDSGPSYDILNLADVANSSRRMTHLMILISIVLSRRLAMLVSALVLMSYISHNFYILMKLERCIVVQSACASMAIIGHYLSQLSFRSLLCQVVPMSDRHNRSHAALLGPNGSVYCWPPRPPVVLNLETMHARGSIDRD